MANLRHQEPIKHTLRAHYSVCIYNVNRAYGGPEEGGWWYDYGNPLVRPHQWGAVRNRKYKYPRQHRIYRAYWFTTERKAYAFRNRLQDRLDKLNDARGSEADLGSVSCQGRLVARVSEGEPMPFPERKPRYE